MNEWLLKQYVQRKTQQNIMKTEHVCGDCGHTGKIVRRMSVLYLIGYIILSVLAGVFLKWWAGFFVFFILMYFTAKTAKPQCRKCFSENVSIPKQHGIETDLVSKHEHTHS